MKSVREILEKSKLAESRKEKRGPCPRHGEFEQVFMESRVPCFSGWTICPTCNAEYEAENAEREKSNRLQDAASRWHTKLVDAGIPERYRELTLEDYQDYTKGQKEALKWAQTYLRTFNDTKATGRNYVLLGKPGTGKTMLCACIAMALLRTGRTAIFTTLLRALRRVKSTYNDDATETEEQAIQAFIAPDLLVLDELGVQSGSAFEKNLTFDIINERYQLKRPTLFVSNLTKAELTEYLGERVMDRLREDGGRALVFDWESYRDPRGR